MRPRSYARKPTDAHTSSRTHPRAHTYIHPCTHMYARIRAREGIFLTTNIVYSITKPSSIISPTPFQSLYNPYPHWYHIACAICTNCQHLPLICYILSSISNHYPTIHRLLIIHSIICPTISHTLSLPTIISHIIFYLYPMTSPTHHLFQYVSML